MDIELKKDWKNWKKRVHRIQVWHLSLYGLSEEPQGCLV